MNIKLLLCTALLASPFAFISNTFAQEDEPAKVKHAEPLYLDLMRDLGARKGEAEFNFGYGRGVNKDSKEHTGFVEYEWAPLNRLGLEVEIPLSFSKNNLDGTHEKVEGIKLGGQYTFLVDEKHQTSMAIGYMQEFEFMQSDVPMARRNTFKGYVYSPFFVAAKNFNQISTLLYVAPFIEQDRITRHVDTEWSFNGSVHYMIPETGHFIGIENNINLHHGKVDYVMRPQIKVALKHNFAIGVLSGIPIHSDRFQMDFMTRVIWEPNFKKGK